VTGTWSDDSSAYRRDPLTGDVVLYAPGRQLRPHPVLPKAATRPPAAGVDPDCPFCPGNEHLLPPIGWEVPGPTSGEWLARVVPNKYPIVPGTWRHLVVIETPRHGEGLESLPSAHLETVLRTYRRVFGEVSSGAGVRCGVLFRNQGVAGGASLAHPHTQVVGVEVVPDRVRRREARCRRHYARTGRCLLCDTMAAEEATGVRMVTATPGFVAFVPWAAEVPCDTWIVPRRHQADFRELRDDEVPGLAAVLREVLTGVGAVSSAYNVTLESCSLDPGGPPGTGVGGDPALHWFLRVRPRVTTAAGFEVATGMSINPSLPEHDAARLRGLRGA
jgi:UDPglucose--hexose-1-phosphate uridylyltransferase